MESHPGEPPLWPLQGGGVFSNPCSPSAPAKLRLLYEVSPHVAGGDAVLPTGVRACDTLLRGRVFGDRHGISRHIAAPQVLPLAFVVEAAGGASHDGAGSALDRTLASHDERGIVCLGSADEVVRCEAAMSAGLVPA